MNSIFVYVCAGFLLLVSACEIEETQSYIPIPADYKSWHQPIKKSLDYQIPGHGDSRRIVFLNAKARQAKIIKDDNNTKMVYFPDGAIIIKEVYKREGRGYQVTPQLVVMVKDRKNENAQDGWLYYARNAVSPKVRLITSRFCVGCHEAANEIHPYFDNNLEGLFRDYVFLNVAK
jgi:hypothetical protein